MAIVFISSHCMIVISDVIKESSFSTISNGSSLISFFTKILLIPLTSSFNICWYHLFSVHKLSQEEIKAHAKMGSQLGSAWMLTLFIISCVSRGEAFNIRRGQNNIHR